MPQRRAERVTVPVAVVPADAPTTVQAVVLDAVEPVRLDAEMVAVADADPHVLTAVGMGAHRDVEMDAKAVQGVQVVLIVAIATPDASQLVQAAVVEAVTADAQIIAVVAEAPVLIAAAEAATLAATEAVAADATVVLVHATADAQHHVYPDVPRHALAAKHAQDVRRTVRQAVETDVWHPAWLQQADRETLYLLTGRQILTGQAQNIIRVTASSETRISIYGRSGSISTLQQTAE